MSVSSAEENNRPDRTWSRTVRTWRSMRPSPVGGQDVDCGHVPRTCPSSTEQTAEWCARAQRRVRLCPGHLPGPARLAFLTACGSACNVECLADEALHIASPFLLAGFPTAVGTLWKIDSTHADHMTRNVCRGSASACSPVRGCVRRTWCSARTWVVALRTISIYL
ncbi:CHAT domain-containing protein [Streptomyces olivaceus]|nr:CHAT domain-containing protein [Streptomyces olivaceus]